MNRYSLKLFKNGGKVKIVRTGKKRRFLNFLRTINWQNGIKKVYLKVSYGKKQCNYGCTCDFYNDGYCANKEELLNVFRYFNEED